jgi:hypothetical protein
MGPVSRHSPRAAQPRSLTRSPAHSLLSYYLWDLEPASPKPLILVQESQFSHLLTEINSRLDLTLAITDETRKEAFITQFPNHPRCLPRYLGRLNRSLSREAYTNMVDHAPARSFRPNGEPPVPDVTGPTLDAFKKLMEDAFEAQKGKSKAQKAKKQQDRLVKQKVMADQLKRAQRYLGLRPSPFPEAQQQQQQSGPPPAIDPTLPAPFDFDQSVVFVCVDVESYERAHHKITEVGVSTLDTRDLVGVPPGPDGENWRNKIHTHHFRIKEHAHLVNRQFVTGCPESFIFGKSTMVSLKDAPAHVAVCFNPPFCAHDFTTGSIEEAITNIDLSEKRNVILLGHDTVSDIKYLQNLGYDPLKVQSIIEALDTAIMYQVWRREYQATNLGKILYSFDIRAWALHNAGNDAAFTIQAMLAVAVREATLRGSPELDAMRNSEQEARLASAVEEARQRIIDDEVGWSDNDDDGDGGVPLPILIKEPKAEVHPQAEAPTKSVAPPTVLQTGHGGSYRGDSHGGGRGRGGRGTFATHGDHDWNGPRSQRAQQDSRGQSRGRRSGGHYRGRARGQPSNGSNGNSDAVSSGELQVRLNSLQQPSL